METANLIQKLGLEPKRTIRVVKWMMKRTVRRDEKQYTEKDQKRLANHFAAMETTVARSSDWRRHYQKENRK